MTTQAYKGYLIHHNPIRDDYCISKGGFHISYAETMDRAKEIIDQLV